MDEWDANGLHRGGEEVLLDVGGQDATEAFEDVGHSDEAREILEGLLVGNLKRVVWPPLPPPPRSSIRSGCLLAITTSRPLSYSMLCERGDLMLSMTGRRPST